MPLISNAEHMIEARSTIDVMSNNYFLFSRLALTSLTAIRVGCSSANIALWDAFFFPPSKIYTMDSVIIYVQKNSSFIYIFLCLRG